MITHQQERLADIRWEVEPSLLLHLEETTGAPPDIDWGTYARIEQMGALHITTARKNGALVGYAAYFVSPNLHRRSLVVAESDMLWLAPEHRSGDTCTHLLQSAESSLKSLGVSKIVNKVQGLQETDAVFIQLGYEFVERSYAKRVA